MAYSAEQQIHNQFLETTIYLPQVPHGCVEIGAAALRLDIDGRLPWYNFLTRPMEGDNLTAAIKRTNEEHGKVGIPELPGLVKSLPFTYELVRAALASSFPATERLDDIEAVTPESAARSADFMFDAGRRSFALEVLDLATGVLHTRDIVRGIGKYQIKMRDAAAEYGGKPDQARKFMKVKDQLRQSVTDLTREPMTEALTAMRAEAPTGLDMAVVAHNLTRWHPAMSLIRKHFPQ